MEKMQFGSKSNAHRSATASGSGKHKRKGGGGGGDSKQPIKVVYISNPMRVTTSEAGFRALVQELTGRDADPSKYGGGASSGGSPAGAQGTQPSPSSTVESTDAAGQDVPAAAYDYDYDDDDEDEDSLAPQLIDNRYSVFSPPTFLYGSHNEV